MLQFRTISLALVAMLLAFCGPSSIRAQVWGFQANNTGGLVSGGTSIATDTAGNHYVTGLFNGTCAFGGPAITSTLNDFYLAKLDYAGNFIWVVRGIGAGDEEGLDLALDDSGFVYLTGRHSAMITFPSAGPVISLPNSGQSDAFVAKFDPANGNAIWARRFESPMAEHGQSICVNGNSVYVTGSFEGTCNFGAFSLAAMGASADLYLAELNAQTGIVNWVIRGATGLEDLGAGIATDGTNLFLTGFYGVGAFNLNGFNAVGTGFREAFIAKLNPLGIVQWLRPIASAARSESGTGVAVSNGKVFVTGFTDGAGTLNFNGNLGPMLPVNFTGNNDNYWICRYDAITGNPDWAFGGGFNGNDRYQDVTVSSNGNVFVAGFYEDSVRIGASTYIGMGTPAGQEVVVVEYQPMGVVANTWFGGGVGVDLGMAIATGPCGFVSTGGYSNDFSTPPFIFPTSALVGNLWIGGSNPAGTAPSAVLPANSAICLYDSVLLTVSPVLAGIQWESSPGPNGPWTLIPGANSTTYMAHPAMDLWYHATSTNACGGSTAPAFIDVSSTFVSATSTQPTYCSNAAAFTLTGSASPAGTWTSTTAGILDNLDGTATFTPSAAPIGNSSVIYTIPGVCVIPDTQSFNIVAPTPVTFAGLAAIYCANASAVTLTGSAAPGGTWTCSTTGLIDNLNGTATFDPALAAVGGPHTITYHFVDGNGCMSSSAQTTNVTSVSTYNISPLPSTICSNAALLNISGSVTPVGVFSGSGAGLVDNLNGSATLDPSLAPLGNFTITYTSGGACVVPATSNINIVAPTPVSFAGLAASYCANAAAVTLTGSAAPGGTWTCSTTGLTDNLNGTATFDPALAAVGGPHTITYHFVDGNGCMSSSAQTTNVSAVSTYTINALPATICSNAALLTINGSVSPVGVFSGSGAGLVDNLNGSATLDPALAPLGNFTITYTGAGPCVLPATANINIVAPTPVSFSGLAASYCANAAAVTLTGSSAPGGTWTCSTTGLTDNLNGTATFDPSLAAVGGPHTITYQYVDGNGCTSSSAQTTNVSAVSTYTINLLPATICSNATLLTINGSVSPVGVFSGSGAGLVDNLNGTATLDPSLAPLGNFTITYTSAGPCVLPATANTNIVAPTPVSFAGLAASYCANESAVTLTGSSAPGGTWTCSTTGLTDNLNGTATFDPALAAVGGPHTITYHFVDGNGCTSSSAQTTNVSAVSTYSINALPATICSNAALLNISGSVTPVGVFSGSGAGLVDNLNGSATLDPALAPLGNFTITYTSAGPCVLPATANINIVAPTPVSFAGLAASYCANAAAVSLTGSSAPGGTWTCSTTGLTDNLNGTATFDPALAAVGGPHTITYQYVDGNGCTSSSAQTTNVTAVSTYSITALPATVCSNAALLNISGSVTPVGVFSGSGTGLVDNLNGTATLDPSLAPLGNFTITYTSGGPCVLPATANINIVAPTPVTFAGLAASYCANSAAVTLTGSSAPGGTWTCSTTGLTDNLNGTATFDPALAAVGGPHTITYHFVDGNGCTSSSAQTTNVTAVSTYTINPLPSTICSNAALLTINGSVTPVGVFSGSGAGLVDNLNGSATLDPSVAPLGNFSITYTSGGACVVPATANINIVAPTPVSFAGLAASYCANAAPMTLTGSSAPGGTWTCSTTGLTDNLNGTATFDPALAAMGGPHTITYHFVDGNGCMSSSSQTTNITAVATYSINPLPTTLCSNATLLTISGSVTPVGVFSGSGAGLVDNLNGTATLDPALAPLGNFSITYTSGGACVVPATANINIVAPAAVSFSGLAASYCANTAPITLTGSAAPGGTWTCSTTGLTDNLNGTATFDPALAAVGGPHTITYHFVDGNGCMSSSAQTTNVSAVSTYTINALPATICSNAALLNISGSVTPVGVFSGSGPGLVDNLNGSATLDPSLAPLGNFSITYTSGGACVVPATANINIVAPTPVSFVGLAASYCANASTVTLTGSSAPGGTWTCYTTGLTDNLNGTATFDPSLAAVGGPHTISYNFVDGNGCTSSSSQTTNVSAVSTYTINAFPATICSNAALLNINGSVTPVGVFSGSGAGLVDNLNGTATLDPSLAPLGNFSITYTSAGPCVLPATANINIVAPTPVSFVGLAASYCANASAVTLTGSSAPGGTWTCSTTGFTDNLNGTATFDPALAAVGGPHTINYSFVDGNGCTNSSTQTTIVTAVATYTINPLPATICSNAALLTINGSLTPVGVFSGSGAGLVDNLNGSATFDPSLAPLGNFSITYTGAGPCVLPATANINIVAPTAVSFAGLAASYCANASAVTLTGSAAPGGTWTCSSTGLTDNLNGTATFDPALAAVVGPHTITYHFVDGNGCMSSSAQTTNVSLLPNAFAGNDTVVCPGVALTMGDSAVLGYGYSWTGNPGGSLGTQFPYSFVSSGTQELYLQVINGACIVLDTAVITVQAIPFADAGPDSTACEGDFIVLGGPLTTGGTPIWRDFNGAVLDSTPMLAHTVNGNQTLILEVVSTAGCNASDTVVVTGVMAPSPVDAGPDQALSTNSTTLNASVPTWGLGSWTSTGGLSFNAANSPTTLVSGLSFGQNILVWTVSNSPCPLVSDTVIITLDMLLVPSGFSPNDDRVNDLFEIEGLENYPNAKIQIFNRWGAIVFEAAPYQNNWAGTNQYGLEIGDDTYFFVLELNGAESRTGYVVVKR